MLELGNPNVVRFTIFFNDCKLPLKIRASAAWQRRTITLLKCIKKIGIFVKRHIWGFLFICVYYFLFAQNYPRRVTKVLSSVLFFSLYYFARDFKRLFLTSVGLISKTSFTFLPTERFSYFRFILRMDI